MEASNLVGVFGATLLGTMMIVNVGAQLAGRFWSLDLAQAFALFMFAGLVTLAFA